ncbi:ATP-binding cassette domain-containing protein [Rubrivivax sp. RP6-9]|uniref:ATP-binding cassette domain-containing protein n=1 Tax=Rubrivivax sp. RP6-9 TaxID=3415750 RepID=UPI003CC6D503
MGDLLATVRLLRAAADRVVLSRLALALLLVTAGGLLGGLAPLALQALVDGVSNPEQALPPAGHDTRSALLLAGSYVAALAGARLFAALRAFPASVAEQRLSANLVSRGFDRLLGQPLTSQLGQRPGAPVHALDQASAGCQILVAHLLGSVVPVVVELCTVVGVLIHVGQPAIVAAFSGTALAYLALQVAAAPRTVARAQAVAQSAQAVRASLTEGLSQPETVKGLGAEQAVRQRLATTLDSLQRCWRALGAQHALLGIANAGCVAVCLVVLLALAIDGLQARTLTSGGFVLINVYLLQMLRPLEALGIATRDIAQALGFMRPLLQMMAAGGCHGQKPEPSPARAELHSTTDPSAATIAPPHASAQRAAPAVRLRGVRFGYDPSRPLLQNIDLDVPPGSMLGLVGPSGSGKSSLIRLLLRLVEPQAGTVLLDDVPLAALSLERLRATTGVVFQDNLMIDDTLAANVAFGFRGATRQDIEVAARHAQLHDRVAAMPDGYDTRIGDRGLLLSGGERQRVAIARALLRSPRLLLLDESTSMLDTGTEAALLRGLRNAVPDCTTILVAHRLSSVRLAQRIAVLKGGVIVESGDHASLMAQGGAYASLWQAQALRSPLQAEDPGRRQ